MVHLSMLSRHLTDPCYVSLMVRAYSRVTGITCHEAIEELGIAGLFDPDEICPDLDDRLLEEVCQDRDGILAWKFANSHR